LIPFTVAVTTLNLHWFGLDTLWQSRSHKFTITNLLHKNIRSTIRSEMTMAVTRSSKLLALPTLFHHSGSRNVHDS